MNELALFAGAGGGILGGRILGWRTVCAVELDPYAREVLLSRQRDGWLEPFPIWNDVSTFDGAAWAGGVDVVSGGFPCQDISSAGKGEGITGEKSGLWTEFARIIGEVRPRFVFVENSPMLTSRGLGRVLGDLAAMGFDAEWGVLGAHHSGAPHQRDRIWIVACHPDRNGKPTCAIDAEVAGLSQLDNRDTNGGEQKAEPEFRPRNAEPLGVREQVPDTNGQRGRSQQECQSGCGDSAKPWDDGASRVVADASCRRCGEPKDGKMELARGAHAVGPSAPSDANRPRPQEQRLAESDETELTAIERPSWWGAEPDVGRVADGVAARVDRLRTIGNGQVPSVAARAFVELSGRLGMNFPTAPAPRQPPGD